jgi:hypothetical protein
MSAMGRDLPCNNAGLHDPVMTGNDVSNVNP